VAFPRRLLAEHETLVFDLKPHWIALAPSAMWTLLIAVIAGFAMTWIDDPSWSDLAILGVALVLFFFLAVVPFLRWMYTNFVLTSDRLITRSGIIAKHSKEIPLETINDVTFGQRVLERIIGAGDLIIESAGESGQNRFTDIRAPEQVQLEIYRAAEARKGLGRPGGPSLADELAKLAQLRDNGVLTDEEFQSRKRKLLES
jgi:uncharacterized membrane protein YdbT with pleckstrin-like domain